MARRRNLGKGLVIGYATRLGKMSIHSERNFAGDNRNRRAFEVGKGKFRVDKNALRPAAMWRFAALQGLDTKNPTSCSTDAGGSLRRSFFAHAAASAHEKRVRPTVFFSRPDVDKWGLTGFCLTPQRTKQQARKKFNAGGVDLLVRAQARASEAVWNAEAHAGSGPERDVIRRTHLRAQ